MNEEPFGGKPIVPMHHQELPGNVRALVLHPDKLLRQKSEPVEGVESAETQGLISDLIKGMYMLGGVGLSAIQCGEPRRIFVMDVNAKLNEEPKLQTFVNPEILGVEGAVRLREGCLSFPTAFAEVTRPARVHVRALTRKGISFEQWLEGWEARVFLHEFDHIEGRLMIDHLSNLGKRLVMKRLVKFSRDIRHQEANEQRAQERAVSRKLRR